VERPEILRHAARGTRVTRHTQSFSFTLAHRHASHAVFDAPSFLPSTYRCLFFSFTHRWTLETVRECVFSFDIGNSVHMLRERRNGERNETTVQTMTWVSISHTFYQNDVSHFYFSKSQRESARVKPANGTPFIPKAAKPTGSLHQNVLSH
jgi:hypothetical protein